VIVVDASVMANMLVYADERGRKARAVLGRDTEWAAPEHWKAEVFSVIRGLVLGNKIKEEQALHAIGRLPHLGIDHVSLDGLLPRMWQLRTRIGAHDAPYVTLAEVRGLTLVTSDSRLARAATAYCRVELVSVAAYPKRTASV
jgi:predicted nucleic acid-binding protein